MALKDDPPKPFIYRPSNYQKKCSKRIKSMIDTAKKFSSMTSIHGIAYVGSHDHSKCSRLFWIVAVVLALVGTAFQLLSILKQWDDQPVVTNLDTISLPVEEVDFPAVTLCPQGATADIMDNVLYQQFQEWLLKRTDKKLQRIKRKKRQIEGCSCKVSDFDPIKIEDLECCFRQFLNDLYPTVYPHMPTRIAAMMNTEEPDQLLENEAILLPKNEANCKKNDNLEILDDLNQKLSRSCPPSFTKKFNDTTCVMKVNQKMTYGKALTHCKEQKGATLFAIDSFEDSKTIEYILGNYTKIL